jgi:translation elongation factor EF-Ts
MSMNLEQIDLLRERTGVSYNDAKEALEKSNNDLVEALVYLEKAHNLKTHKKIDCQSDFTSKCKEVIKKGNNTRFIVKKKDNVVVNLPVTVAGIASVVAFPLAVTGLILAIATNHKIKIEKNNGENIEVQEVINKMSTAVNNVTTNLNK